MNADLPPDPPAIIAPAAMDHRCVAAAAAYYNVPPELIVAVRLVEGGTVGRTSKNTNGSQDIGPMQINTIHLGMFRSWGVSGDALLNNECTNLFAGTYILYRELSKASDMWTGIGNYHSRTAVHHQRYRGLIYNKLIMLKSKYGPYCAWLRRSATKLRAEYQRPAEEGHLIEARNEPR